MAIAPEWVTAIATAFTGLVIFFTVLLGARQLRATADQLAHLRRATQLEGMLTILDVQNRQKMGDAYNFVLREFPARMQDPAFAEEAKHRGSDPTVHKELRVLRMFEIIGTFVKHGLLDVDALLDFYDLAILETWERLAPLVAVQREDSDEPRLWENYEQLYRLAGSYHAKQEQARTK